MKRPDSSTSAKRSLSSGISGAYCALTSTSGITTSECTGLSGRPTARCRENAARRRRPDRAGRADARRLRRSRQPSHAATADDGSGDGDVREAERAVEALPARAGRPADAGEREAPDRRADQRQHRVARAAGPRRSRPGSRRTTARPESGGRGGRPSPPSGQEPCLRPLELGVVEMEPAAVPLEIRTAAAAADLPADHGADRGSRSCRRARSRGRRGSPAENVWPKSVTDWPAIAPDAIGAAVDHHDLAAGREDRVDHHQQEDGVEAVVADRTGSAMLESEATGIDGTVLRVRLRASGRRCAAPAGRARDRSSRARSSRRRGRRTCRP